MRGTPVQPMCSCADIGTTATRRPCCRLSPGPLGTSPSPPLRIARPRSIRSSKRPPNTPPAPPALDGVASREVRTTESCPNALGQALRGFLADHLRRVRGLSRHTLRSCGNAFKLPLIFLEGHLQRPAATLDCSDLPRAPALLPPAPPQRARQLRGDAQRPIGCTALLRTLRGILMQPSDRVPALHLGDGAVQTTAVLRSGAPSR